MARCPVGQQHQFVAALAQGEEQCEQYGPDQQPGPDGDTEYERARGGAQRKADGDRQHVDDHDMFQRTGIHPEQRHVRRRHQPEFHTQAKRGRKGDRPEDHRAADRKTDRDVP